MALENSDLLLVQKADGTLTKITAQSLAAFVALPSLTLTITPSSVAENAGSTTGTVTRSGSTTGALTVNLSSSDTSEATVPATVDIPDGQASANFTITILNENLDDGDQVATISATATGASGASATVTVTDVGVSSFTNINSIALTDINIFAGDHGTSGFVGGGSFVDTGSLGDTWQAASGAQMPIVATSGAGYFANYYQNWNSAPNGIQSNGTPWSAEGDVDVFIVWRKAANRDQQATIFGQGGSFDSMIAWSGVGNQVVPPAWGASVTVDGGAVATQAALFTALDDDQIHIIRIASADLSAVNNPVIGATIASFQPEDSRLYRFVVIPTADATTNLSGINAELQTIIDTA